MEIVNRKGEANVAYTIRGIEGDMGEETLLHLILQADGDVVVCLSNVKTGNIDSIEFCSGSGASQRPVIAKKLGELIAELVKEEGR